jgi:hypothetical protein
VPKSSKQTELHQAVMKGLDQLDKLRTEDVPGIHLKIALLEEKLVNLKEDVRKDAKRDAKIYGGIGSAVATFLAIAMSTFKH